MPRMRPWWIGEEEERNAEKKKNEAKEGME